MRGDRPRAGQDFDDIVQFTPHARGSTVPGPVCPQGLRVYPACAGIDLESLAIDRMFNGLPRMRGDRPRVFPRGIELQSFTPHARGSTPKLAELPDGTDVYPACAGIDLLHPSNCFPCECLPRMRGDRPFLGRQRDTIWKFTPHARGSTVFVASVVVRVSVYPACAGIDLTLRFQRAAFRSLPRMRGDRPALATSLMSTARFTPHARGSTCELVGYALKGGVYPACAGIDHGSPRETQMWDCLPRMRGDRL